MFGGGSGDGKVSLLRRENSVFFVQLTRGRIGNYTRLIPSLLKVMTTHTRANADVL